MGEKRFLEDGVFTGESSPFLKSAKEMRCALEKLFTEENRGIYAENFLTLAEICCEWAKKCEGTVVVSRDALKNCGVIELQAPFLVLQGKDVASALEAISLAKEARLVVKNCKILEKGVYISLECPLNE